jgi:hypothetical protein
MNAAEPIREVTWPGGVTGQPDDGANERDGLYDILLDGLFEGEIIPFLGAGASAFARDQEGGAPPDSSTLRRTLAEMAGVSATYNGCSHIRMDLAQVASYYQNCKATRRNLDRVIKTHIFNPKYQPNLLHRFLARVASIRPMLIITTNYDDLIERAFSAAEVPFEVVATPVNDLAYAGADETGDNEIASGIGSEKAGGVLHWAADATPPQADFVRVEARDVACNLTRNSVIYKVHGTVPRAGGDGEYLIAEEDYTRFLGRMENSGIVPYAIRRKIMEKTGERHVPRNSLLFLGYGIHDWNLRVLLEELRIGQGRSNEERHYAIMRECEREERELLQSRKITVYNYDLSKFTREIGERLCLRQTL